MKTVFIAGGGTGGHIYPGLAIAKAISQLDSQVEVHFVGTSKGLENKIIPREGYPLHLIAGGKLNFSGQFLEKLKTLFKLPLGFVQSFGLLLKYRPDYVLGVGGYASGPFVLIASLMRFRTGLWEPNALPGLTNKLLSRFVKNCFIVFDQAKNSLSSKNILNCGMPVRSEIENSQKKIITNSQFNILVFGGSQGARAINQAVSAAIESSLWPANVKLVHQVGSLDLETYKKKYSAKEDLVEMHEFLYDMPKYYQWADLVIARAGASTIAELAAFGIPAILIPLTVADGHQEKNAESLASKNAAILLLQKNLTPESLIRNVLELKENIELRKQMSKNIKEFFQPQAAQKIARQMLHE